MTEAEFYEKIVYLCAGANVLQREVHKKRWIPDRDDVSMDDYLDIVDRISTASEALNDLRDKFNVVTAIDVEVELEYHLGPITNSN